MCVCTSLLCLHTTASLPCIYVDTYMYIYMNIYIYIAC